MKEKTCCFTGHRDIPKGEIWTLKRQVRSLIKQFIKQGIVYFEVGGAIGFDLLVEEIILSLKPKYPQIQLKLLLPYSDHTKYWKEKDKKRFAKVMEQADEVIYVSDQPYTPSCMQKRNCRMVDDSTVCIAYYRKKSGGTHYTVNYCKMVNLCLFII